MPGWCGIAPFCTLRTPVSTEKKKTRNYSHGQENLIVASINDLPQKHDPFALHLRTQAVEGSLGHDLRMASTPRKRKRISADLHRTHARKTYSASSSAVQAVSPLMSRSCTARLVA
jgi:hypothetical protein